MGSARVSSFSADQLRAARTAAGLSQASLARALGPGFWRTDIWRYEHGLRWPSPRTLTRLAAALSIDTARLTTAAAPTIADLRQLAGLTQAEAAAAVGVTVDVWATLEHGRGEIGAYQDATARVLRVSHATVRAAHERAAGQSAGIVA